MMATTHVLVGVAIAAAASLAVPELGALAVVAAAAGGVFPDLDLYAGHRKTLHFPVYYPVMASAAGAALLVSSSPWLWAVTLFLVAAAAHALMDAFGGGLELRPWRGTSEKAVYSHFHDRWVAPRRWIRYDGAPEDLGLALIAAVPGLVTFEGRVGLAVIGLLAISAFYVLLRKPLVAIAERLVQLVPAAVRGRLPRRFVEDLM
jgi:hypothetical protein